MSPVGPAALYRDRLREREGTLDSLERRFRLLARWRLAAFAVGAGLAWSVVAGPRLSPAWLLVPGLAFLALVIAHERVVARRERARRAVAFYQRGLDRLEHRWMRSGEDGVRFRDRAHLYASDLDLFGPGSLFQYLNTARTGVGQETLARWLLGSALPDVVAARQVAVRELAAMLDFREELAVLGDDAQAGLAAGGLERWGTAPRVAFSAFEQFAAPVIGGASLIAVIAALAWHLPALVPALTVAAGNLLGLALRTRARAVLGRVAAPVRELALLRDLLARVEREPFTSPLLMAHRSQLTVGAASAAAETHRLERLVHLADSRANLIFAPVAALLLLGSQLAMALERWRARWGVAILDWVRVLGEVEALASLGALAAEHPEDVFPSFIGEGPCCHATAMAHPLLPLATVVPNDVALDREMRLLVVSGSNMSGKTTLLRAVGANVVLAGAGAPVRASRFELSSLRVGASLIDRDSLLDGKSRFYAEILRVRDIVAACRANPGGLLYLLDELLAGTNSHDRAVGAGAIMRWLVETGAIGMVTTHDLALTAVGRELAPLAQNLHFEDTVAGGEIRFDYRLRPGVVSRSNALELMRSVGLDVSGAP